ncbi:rhomboid family intramembrane serine protease [Hansschlegelia zhihuaiae]|uniref:Rhomboid family intramembrane serine protease n=1 Tax=Hansschlegelia zhihuaiae TaxID=405005 RepID=A0A4Q0MNR5_9HYPH|nr:rhomboid family intramembrane serine protease [Hansschlegelia zhihuaiae]RXF75420.1 rhomboid family intramembrane serine protease [Hansschlegelia zhihuaiae]
MPPPGEPAFNAPRVVLVALAAFVAIHLLRSVVSEETDIGLLLRFAFIPARYDAASQYASDMLGGEGAKLWTFVSYAFLHGDWMHLAVNSVWMLAFGSALAWRFGPGRFLLFSALTAAAGAATHLLFHFGEPTPVIGASAAISGHMAAATRFIFEVGGPLSAFRQAGHGAFMAPAEPFMQALRRPQVIVFFVAWFGMNILFGLGAIAIGEGDASIAWEAHIGGFLAGLALFPLFDPVRGEPAPHPFASHPDGAWDDGLRADGDRPHDGGAGPAQRPGRDS